MARRRLGVALVLDGPVGTEIDGLRRAVGDRALDRIVPHITLVPPVNVREGDLPAALGLLRAAAGAAPPVLELTLGPPSDFLPANPVLHLPVGGDQAELGAIRDRVFAGPLARPLTWPYVPHVTLGDDLDPARIAAARLALDGYRVTVGIERIHLLEERHEGGRRWEAIADVDLGRPGVVGRGGLARTLTRSRLVDPEALLLPGAAEVVALLAPEHARRAVVTVRQEDVVVGLGAAWLEPDGGAVTVIVHPAERGRGLGGILLREVEAAVEDRGWGCRRLRAIGPAGFYLARSAFSQPSGSEGRSSGQPKRMAE